MLLFAKLIKLRKFPTMTQKIFQYFILCHIGNFRALSQIFYLNMPIFKYFLFM